MSGHSKWATIKHKKGAKDAKRGALFGKLIRAIEVAARQGGSDPAGNATLATMIAKARAASVPMDNIDRAIKRGAGELDGVSYESITYEGYGPDGVAMLVEVLTDNRNRAASDVRSTFSRNGGNLGEPGSVAWIFSERGIVQVAAGSVSEDRLLEVALDAGASDLDTEGEIWEIVCEPRVLNGLRAALEGAGVPVESAELSMIPSTTIALDAHNAGRVLRLVDALEELDDVQNVYANFDIPEDVLESLAS
jgi:YebC/PmpR family DNA-binding regulatory protein